MTMYALAERREQVYEVVGLSFVHQTDDGARASERASQHGLQQRVRSDLHHHGIVRDVLQRFAEQHRAHLLTVYVTTTTTSAQ